MISPRWRHRATLIRGLAGELRSWNRPYRRPIGGATLDDEDDDRIRHWLERPGDWSDPAPLHRYERAFAEWNGSKAAFAFDSARAAMSASIEALGLGVGDEVILPAFTCVAVPNAFRFAGVRIRWADIELETYGLDIASVARRIGPQTRAIVVQHTFGLVSRDYEALLTLAHERRLWVIEDCAHATGARWRGERLGWRGHVAIYSSEQAKAFCTVRGGVVTTSEPRLGSALEAIARRAPAHGPETTAAWLRHGRYLYEARQSGRFKRHLSFYRHAPAPAASTTGEEMAGLRPPTYGGRLPSPLADLGSAQLKRIDRFNGTRRANAERWQRWCIEQHLTPPSVLPGSEPTFLRYPVCVEPALKRDPTSIEGALDVPVGVWFLGTEHPNPGVPEDCPQARVAVERCINLPGIP